VFSFEVRDIVYITGSGGELSAVENRTKINCSVETRHFFFMRGLMRGQLVHTTDLHGRCRT